MERDGRTKRGWCVVAKSARRRTVFLVEDSGPLAERLRVFLGEIEGVLVVGQAAGAREAVAAIRTLGPDVIVLDLHLAEGSGFDVLREVRQDGSGARVVVLTNHGSLPYRRKALQEGADHFLDKATEFDRLGEAILGADSPLRPGPGPEEPGGR